MCSFIIDLISAAISMAALHINLKSMRLIRTCAGIGDSIWLFMKLINANEKFDFQISGSKPQRGKQIFDLLPSVANSCVYVDGLRYENIRQTSKQFDGANFVDIQEKDFSLAANYHLEQGNRIENFLPDLKTSFQISWDTDNSGFSITDLPPAPGYIGVYCSKYESNKAWGQWTERQWLDLIQKIHAEKSDTVFCIIGALFDIDLSGKLIALLRANNIPFHDTIGKPLAYVVELLKRLDYFIGFPSGLSILNETLGKKTFMFYPPHLEKMIDTWAEPDRILLDQYIGTLFCSPMEAFNIIANRTNILE